LRSRFGRAWRRKAPVESLMPLRLARYGVPLAETAPSGLAAAGIEPALLPPAPVSAAPELVQAAPATPVAQETPGEPTAAEEASPWFQTPPQAASYDGGYDPTYDPEQEYEQWYEGQQDLPQPQAFIPAQAQDQAQPQLQVQPQLQDPEFPVPAGPGRTRPLGDGIPVAQEEPPNEDGFYQVFKKSIEGEGMPTPGAFAANIEATYGLKLEPRDLHRYVDEFTARLNNEFIENHIA
ncbi:hypothetical protein ACFVYY_43060, partial [Streptomyces sp. NPDC058297]